MLWFENLALGKTSADLISDVSTRKRVKDEAYRRLNRRVTVRWSGIVLWWLLFSAVFWTWVWRTGGSGSASLGQIVILALILGVATGVAEIARVRIWRGSYERELWKVMHECGIPICVHCGYSRAGAPEARCPECGQAAELS